MMAVVDHTFPHAWTAEVLPSRPLILPARQYVYPAMVDEVEIGALELLVRPADGAQPFLATCALGFASPAVPSGVWSCPDPEMLCAASGGYVYLIQTGRPKQFIQVEYRPVTEIRALRDAGLLLFASFHAVQAWGAEGLAWRSERLSWEGVKLGEAQGDSLQGWGWDMRTDREVEFALDLRTGRHTGGPRF